ncbi:Flp pilus assembly protein TadD, contains TPR repeats [Ruegeria halocynthiae]|uniref:Flp pilus assembly protein TadD, contains TPR repeats n=1 Tax=Ruegeria halocynthiae TaxID=985054 RepID=A0A1H2ZCB0_9RHOB|nr:tetratricopeptide repeat protein [Ruegeria halocynthiae]SDX15021.1 Flp pilus assembly protein TadD, contains TPR repeats [Ruegeria halocynthiae]
MVSLVRRAALAVILSSSIALPAVSDTGSGSYLAGRQAIYQSDYPAAERYYARALQADPENPKLLENVVVARLALGEIERALTVADVIEKKELPSQAARMVISANLVADGKMDEFLARDPETQGVGPLVDGLMIAWAYIGQGAMTKAMEQFDDVATQEGLREFAQYHKAMALASVGDFESAEAIFAADDDLVGRFSRRAVLARAEVLSQLDRNDDALQFLNNVFAAGSDPTIEGYTDRLSDGETLPFTHVRSARDGMAEVFFSVGAALSTEAAQDYVLLYARIATFLRPDHIDAILLSAELLDGLEQYDLAVDVYRQVPPGSSDYHAAELGRAEVLSRSDRKDAAAEVLQNLAAQSPDLPGVHVALADLRRQQEDYAAAVTSYDKAIDLTEAGAGSNWFLHYARGISHERLKNWDQAEADFRRALELNPDQPQVLNYLGYSLVERQEKLDEALNMIERAASARPDSGYIVDSLGWVLFRLGRYDEAVEHMERAVELMPVDPVVNDHLGDVYWAVGRAREAEFQWKRALSFIDPEDVDGEADPDRIRRKIEIGLDVVLQEEGAEPLKVANDG